MKEIIFWKERAVGKVQPPLAAAQHLETIAADIERFRNNQFSKTNPP